MSAPAIFLSYAREDAAAARRIAEALRGAGVEVWFDENELTGGDAWDAKIRRQIRDCALLLPVISRNTQRRREGYFRLEWHLAEERSRLIARGTPFLVPVVIDETPERDALVPEAFLAVQWTRLRDGEVTPQFADLVRRLTAPPEPGRPRPGERGEGAAFPGGRAEVRRRMPAAAWLGAAAVVMIGIAAAWFASRKAEPSAGTRQLPAEKSVAAAAPPSEARQLVAKARALYEPWDLATPEDFTLAEDLLKRAVALDPSDGEAWAAYALVACGRRVMLDFSEAAGTAARSRAETAIKLAPELPLARFARAFSLRFNPQTQEQAIRLLREEAGRQPSDRFVVRTLAAALRSTGQFEQSLVYFDKAVALPGKDAVTHYNRGLSLKLLRRFDEAEAAFDEALAIAPHYAGANMEKVSLLLDIRRDLAFAQTHLAKIPANPIANQATALGTYQMAMLLKQPARALEVLRDVNDFLVSSGPKATLTAVAHRMAGNEEAARTDLKAALRLVEDRLAAQPNDALLLGYKAEILALQGERAAAEPIMRELQQRIAAGDRSGTALNDQSAINERLAYLFMLLNQQEAALSALEARFGTESKEYRAKVGLRYDPVWDPLRGNPRFEALLQAEPARKK